MYQQNLQIQNNPSKMFVQLEMSDFIERKRKQFQKNHNFNLMQEAHCGTLNPEVPNVFFELRGLCSKLNPKTTF